MKTSCTVYLYSNLPFAESDNAIFDDMAAVLYDADEIESHILAAPFNPTLYASLRLPLDEKLASALESGAKISYVEAAFTSGTDHSRYFYFVESAKRIANQVCLLTMKMDTLNTYNLVGKLAPTCYITREHKDRFQFEGISNDVILLHSKIDLVDEGYAPALYRTVDHKITSAHDYDYYLIYKTRDDITAENLTNPISVYLCADSPLKVLTGSSGGVVTLHPSDLSDSAYYYIDESAGEWEVYDGSITRNDHSGDTFGYNGTNINVTASAIMFYKASDTFIYWVEIGEKVGDFQLGSFYWQAGSHSCSSLTLNKCKEYYSISARTNQKAEYLGKNTVTVNSGTVGDVYSKAFSTIDRADSKLVKIIDLPYCPVFNSIDASGNWSFSGFSYDRPLGIWKATNPAMDFIASLPSDCIESVVDDALIKAVPVTTKDAFIATERANHDPKLFSSAFHRVKLTYDSFSLLVPLEAIDLNPDVEYSDIGLNFKATNTVNSNFMFSLTFANASIRGQSDYPTVLLSTRNNEMTIFTNDYINYLKTGYNYDKKAKALSATSAFLSSGLSIATGVGAAVAGAATGNPITAAAGVTMIGSGIAGISSAITTTISSENSFASKLAGLQAQATGTAGSDDIDLLKSYSGNRLHLSVWSTSAPVFSLLDNLFRYYGYKSARYGEPNLFSRTCYNYCAAQIQLKKETHVPADVFEDEANKWASGVTDFHPITGAGRKYDYDRENENWETSIVSAAFPS